ncbi:MAG TPA: hypothetical protein VHW26_05310 [Solirubrobacteraceae bacterium]|nr:hypothetical protein [Solirubrobacteraceae bacterium]
MCAPLLVGVPSAFAVTVTAGTLSSVEGAPFTGQVATFSDVALLACQSIASYSSTVAWTDDGTTTAATIGTPAFNGLSCTYPVIAQHRFTAIGAQHMTVSVAGPLGSDSATGTANVTAAPLNSQPVPATAVEGASFTATLATFTDGFAGRPASHYTAAVDWGDGSTSLATVVPTAATGTFDIAASHTYADVGNYATTVRITDPEGSHTTAASTTSVADAPLSSTPVAKTVLEAQQFSATLARFADADPGRPASHYTATVDWGDGSGPSPASVVADPAGGFDANAGHTYADAGTYTTTVTITDPGGSQSTAVGQTTVADRPLHSAGIATNAVAGQAFTANMAVFTDDDAGRPASHYAATVDWGDGSTTPAPSITADTAGGYEVSATHTYAAAGSFPTTVTITDPGGSQTTASSTATVAPAPAPPPADTPPPTTPDSPATPAPAATPTPTPTKTTAASILPTPKVSLTSPRLSSAGTTISIGVTCPTGGASCQGVVRLTTLPAAGSKVAALRRGTTLGSVLFVLHPGQSKTFSVHVAAPTLRLLRQAGTARVQGVAVGFGQAGSATATGAVARIAAAGSAAKPKAKPKAKAKAKKSAKAKKN